MEQPVPRHDWPPKLWQAACTQHVASNHCRVCWSERATMLTLGMRVRLPTAGLCAQTDVQCHICQSGLRTSQLYMKRLEATCCVQGVRHDLYLGAGACFRQVHS